MLSLVAIAQVTTSLGLPSALTRYLPEYRQKRDNYSQKRLLVIVLLLQLIFGLIFVFLLLYFDQAIIDIFKLPQYSKAILLIVGIIILFFLESFLIGDSALISIFENKYWNFSRSLYTLIKFILFYFSLQCGFGITGIIWSWLIAEIFVFFLFLKHAYDSILSLPIKKGEKVSLESKRIFKFALPISISSYSYFLRDQASDKFFLSYFFGMDAVGLYSFAMGIPNILMNFSIAAILRPVLTPYLINSVTKSEEKSQIHYFFQLLTKLTFFAVVPVFTATMVLADKIIIYIFNPSYLSVTNLFILCLGFLMIQKFKYSYGIIIFTLEKNKIMLFSGLIAFYNLFMDILLIPWIGIFGAAIATGSAGILLVLYDHFALKRTGINLEYPWKSISKFSINIIFVMIILFFLNNFIYNIITLITVLFLGILIYLGISYFNKGFDQRDRDVLNKLIGKRLFKF